MKVLITGSSGFIGSHLMDLLGERKIDTYGFDLKCGVDIRGALPKEDFTHIFHLAAKRSVPKGEEEPIEFISTNCWGTLNLLRTYPNARFLNISSSAAEEAKSVYGATKLFAEKMGNQHSNCLNVRLYNVFGERQPLESGAVVPTWINCMLKGEKPIIRGAGAPTRDFTYVKDVCEELYYLMFETFNKGLAHVGYANPLSLNELFHLIFQDSPIVPDYQDLRPYEIFHNKAPYLLFSPTFGKHFNKLYGLRSGIKRTIAWWKKLNETPISVHSHNHKEKP